LDADEGDTSFSDDDDDSDSDIQPGTSGKRREVAVNNMAVCDSVAASDGCTSSENSKDGISKDAIEDGCKITVEAASR
jgi:hypothetical protein